MSDPQYPYVRVVTQEWNVGFVTRVEFVVPPIVIKDLSVADWLARATAMVEKFKATQQLLEGRHGA